MRASRVVRDEEIAKRGDPRPDRAAAGDRTLRPRISGRSRATVPSGPRAAVADVRADRATVWSASQATHGFQSAFARMLGLDASKVRLIYLDGSGCYGMNGRRMRSRMPRCCPRPRAVRCACSGPARRSTAATRRAAPASRTARRRRRQGEIVAWETQAWLPLATANLPNIPLLSLEAAGIPQPTGRSTGLIQQNVDPPYTIPNMRAVIHWTQGHAAAPLRLRAPGQGRATTFAIESFMDEVASLAGPTRSSSASAISRIRAESRSSGASPRGWGGSRAPRHSRSIPGGGAHGPRLRLCPLQAQRELVAMGMEVEVERATGRIRVTRVVCAHDCGLMVNPDCVQSQLEGNILQRSQPYAPRGGRL